MHLQIDAAEFLARIKNGETMNLLDVRETIEYHTFNIGGKNIPLGMIDMNLALAGYNKTNEIIVICSVGLRSETAAKFLAANGYENVRNLTGGILALRKIKE